MKSQFQIYNERLQINNEKKELKRQLKIKETDLSSLRNQCSHKLILAFDNHQPHKIGKIIECFCPACEKRENIYDNHEIEKSAFTDSKIIDLTHFPKHIFNEQFSAILEYIFSNYDYCYSDDTSENEIAKAILDLVNVEEKEDNNSKIIRKIR